MGVGNVGIGILLPLVMLILWIAVIVAIFQIRNATRSTSEKLDAIYKIMIENKRSD